MTKRKEGKKNADYKLKDVYKAYVKHQEGKSYQIMSYKVFTDVIKACNKLIINNVLEGETLKLPFLGSLGVIKNDAAYNLNHKKKWPVDWVKSKELGYKVYIEQPYYYGYYWFKNNPKHTNKKYYKFHPCRKAKRTLAQAVKNGMDYSKLQK